MKKIVWALFLCAASLDVLANDDGTGIETPAFSLPGQALSIDYLALLPGGRKHFYTLKDGEEYGYERVLSENDENSGRVAPGLSMVKFLGEQDGVLQAIMDSPVPKHKMIAQCTRPCEFIKLMVVRGDILVNKQTIRGGLSVAAEMMADAMAGNLIQSTKKIDGQIYHQWFDEETGFQRSPVTEPPAAP